MRQRVGLTTIWMYKINTQPQVSKIGLERKISRKMHWLHQSRIFAFGYFGCFGWIGSYFVFLCFFGSISLAFQILLSSYMFYPCLPYGLPVLCASIRTCFYFRRTWDGDVLSLIPPMCSSASPLSGGFTVGLWQESNTCSWPQARLQRFHKGLILFTNPSKTDGAAPPKPTLSLSNNQP